MFGRSPSKPARPLVSKVTVFTRPRSHRAVLVAGELTMPCTIGKGGATRAKREGDGRTPRGPMTVLAWYGPSGPGRLPYRGEPRTITATVGWCDDPRSASYNRPVRLPVSASHESMARRDGKYDIVGVLDWNVLPRIRGRGSAIFFHINDDPTGGTEGCVALTRAQMRRLLPRLSKKVVFVVT